MLKELKKYIQKGYKILPININITIYEFKDVDGYVIYIKPSSMISQIKYYNKYSNTSNHDAVLSKAILNSCKIIFLNCNVIVNVDTNIVVIKPCSIWHQIYYLLTFGYLWEPVVLAKDYTIIHKLIDVIYSKIHRYMNK